MRYAITDGAKGTLDVKSNTAQEPIATMNGNLPYRQVMAHAELIKSAPRLLEMLEICISGEGSQADTIERDELIARLRDVFEKAGVRI